MEGITSLFIVALFFVSLVGPPVLVVLAIRRFKRHGTWQSWMALPLTITAALAIVLNPLLQGFASICIWDEESIHFRALAEANGKPDEWIESHYGKPQKTIQTADGEIWSYFSRPWYFYPPHRPTEITLQGGSVTHVGLGEPQTYPFHQPSATETQTL